MTTPQPNPQHSHPVVAPAGWYPDPNGAPAQRWWDGHQWTAHVAPTPRPAAGIGGLYNGAADAAAGKNFAGTWSLIMGIGAFLAGIPRGTTLLSVLFAVAAVVWGGIGLARAGRYGVKRGTSIAGLILGGITLVLTLVWFVVLAS